MPGAGLALAFSRMRDRAASRTTPKRAMLPHMTTLDIARLTPRERLDLIGELWDSLAPEDVRLTPAQAGELARRMATFEADAKSAVPWGHIERELAGRTR